MRLRPRGEEAALAVMLGDLLAKKMKWRRVALALGVLGAALGWAVPRAEAAGNPYTVAKLSVDVTAKDAVTAKAKAIAEAEQRALGIVLRRLVPFNALAAVAGLDPGNAESLIEGFTIRSEKYSTTRYIGSFDFTFNQAAVNQLLASRGIRAGLDPAPSISVLPVVLDGDKVLSAGDSWRQAWLDLDLTNGVIPATVLQPRPELTASAVRGVLAGDARAYAAVQGTYNDQPLVIAVGQPVGGGKFTTRLAGVDGVGPINFGRTTMVPKGGRDEAARDNAAFALAILENRWKAVRSDGGAPATPVSTGQDSEAPPQAAAPQGEPGRNVVALVEFSGLKQWQDMRGRLMHVPGVQALEVNSLSPRMASITFDYAGSLGKLQQVLGDNGFSFENGEENFVIRAR